MPDVDDRWHVTVNGRKVRSARYGQGKRWVARWRDEAGRQRSKSFDRKVDADRRVANVAADLAKGVYVDPSDRTTVGEYARRWLEARPHRPSSARRMSSLIETHIVGTSLGGRRLASVLPSEVQAWASDRAKELGTLTVRSLVSLLRSIYAAAVLDRLVGSSPVVRVALPRHERERVVPLTIEQVGELAAAMPERNRAMVVTQAGLGLRIGELLALRAVDVDFLRRTVRVEFQIPPGSRVRTEPKTPRSRRTVPLPQVVADTLAAHIAGYPPAADGTLFHTRTGRPYRHEHYGSIFKAAVHKVGLPEGTSSHDLRHHYASVLLLAGESVIAVAERLGHQNAGLVLSTYGHLMPDSEERTRKAVDAAWCVPDVRQEAENGR